MPLPIGHALAGIAFQRARPGTFFKKGWQDAIFLMFLANLPDLDFLPGFILGRPNLYHHGVFHSLGAALGAAAFGAGICFLKKRPVVAGRYGPVVAGRYGRFWAPATMIFMVFYSHLLLDFFARDYVYPYGLPLFWPFSGRYFIASRPFFSNITRSSASADFFSSLFNAHNLKAALLEMAILGGIALTAVWLRARVDNRGGKKG